MSDPAEFFKLRNRAIRIAREARADRGLSLLEPLTDVLRTVEQDGVEVAILDLGDGFAGAYYRPAGTAIAFVNGTDPPQRQRFTLAHEYGHHRLGHATRLDRPEAIAGYTDEPDEVQANAFAAEFLVPRDAAIGWAEEHVEGPVTLETVVRFAAAFGVSALAACIRLKTASVATGERTDRLKAEINAGEHEALVEALGIPTPEDAIATASVPHLPASLRTNALGALLTGSITLAQLAATIDRPVAQARAMLDGTGLGALLPRAA